MLSCAAEPRASASADAAAADTPAVEATGSSVSVDSAVVPRVAGGSSAGDDARALASTSAMMRHWRKRAREAESLVAKLQCRVDALARAEPEQWFHEGRWRRAKAVRRNLTVVGGLSLALLRNAGHTGARAFLLSMQLEHLGDAVVWWWERRLGASLQAAHKAWRTARYQAVEAKASGVSWEVELVLGDSTNGSTVESEKAKVVIVAVVIVAVCVLLLLFVVV